MSWLHGREWKSTIQADMRTIKKGPCHHEPFSSSKANYMESTIALPNSEHDNNVAPSIWRSKS